jgi:hypothetical protein
MIRDKIKSKDNDESLNSPHLPSFMVLNENGISQMDYDSVDNKFKASCFSGNKGFHHLVQSKNFVFVTNDHLISRLDRKFCPRKSIELEKIGACVSDRGLLYVSANGYFIILDKDLNVISQLPLGIFSDYSGKKKNAHDIAIKGNVAFLLDNVVEPVYTLKIDMKDQEHPRIMQETEIDYVNQHLDAQWVVPEQNEWRIIQSSSNMGGSFQWFETLDMLIPGAGLTAGLKQLTPGPRNGWSSGKTTNISWASSPWKQAHF